MKFRFVHLSLLLIAAALACSFSCSRSISQGEYFGKVVPPTDRTLRYCSGPEIATLDPQLGTVQSDYRIYMALFEGLTEYDPQTMEPIPGLAESWEVLHDSSEFIFHLRPGARWSNGEPITANDFVYTFRRGLSPGLASSNAPLGSDIKYAQAYTSRGAFVRDPASGAFLLEKDFAPPNTTLAQTSDKRLVLAGKESERAQQLEANPRLRAALEGKEIVPVRAEDIGVEALDEHTLRIVLEQTTPYFIGLTSHPFFRVVPRRAIEGSGSTRNAWLEPQNLISSGPFKLEKWDTYDQLVVVKNPLYWDAERVKLDRIIFYPIDEYTTAMNMYKAGVLDATGNHYVPATWIDVVRPLKDYMDKPELAIQYYLINVTKPPMNDVRVRKAFNLAIDKEALAASRHNVKSVTAFMPPDLFPGYKSPPGDKFDPQRARQLLAEAGFKDGNGNYDPAKFPLDEVEIAANSAPANKEVAEFIQSQWSGNLGLTVPIHMQESRTMNDARKRLEYTGFTRNGFGGDYLDPFTFLSIFTSPNNGSGWTDAKFNQMLIRANLATDAKERFHLLSEAEKYLLDAQPLIPLYSNSTNWLKKPYVQGMYPNPGSLHAWKFVWIEPDPAKWK